jgi:hypothetical protein
MAKMKGVENIDELTKNSGVCKIQLVTAVLLTIRGRKVQVKTPPYTCNNRCTLRRLVRCATKYLCQDTSTDVQQKMYVNTPR